MKTSDLTPRDAQNEISDENALVRLLDVVLGCIDNDWYLRTQPQLAARNVEPAAHFMTIGWQEGCAPFEDFDLETALRSENVLSCMDYLEVGGVDLDAARANGQSRRARLEEAAPIDRRTREHFDATYYTENYAHKLAQGENPFTHYLEKGWKEGLNPSSGFDTDFYLSKHPDLQKAGVQPLEHYALFGEAEGRATMPDGRSQIKRRLLSTGSAEHVSHLLNIPEPSPRIEPGEVDFGAMDIHWVIPDFQRGGGGHMTIFRMVNLLEKMGHKCTIWIEKKIFHHDTESAYEDIVKYFQCVGADVRFVDSSFYHTHGDAVIATAWSTAYPVAAAKNFKSRFYFVQDYEPDFYPRGAESLLAEGTYDLDLACICASPWLSKLMEEQHGRWARHFFLAFDHTVYKEELETSKRKGPLRIAVYARAHTARRATELAFMALDIAARKGVPFEVHFFGQDDLPFDALPYPAQNHGVLDSAELANLYNSCDIGICFSATNYSLIPQEMMACGLPLIELNVASTRAIFPTNVVALSGPAPQDIAKKIEQLIVNPDLRRKQAMLGKEWVQQFKWENSAATVSGAIVERLKMLGATRSAEADLRKEARLKSDVVDIVIPTWNGMGELPPVLEAIRRQKGRAKPNIICVDSSSSDGTAEWLKEQPDVTLKVIPQSEFQHGRTRNLGASLGTAPLIAFLTQDAIPANEYWLHDIWTMMNRFPDAAGLFGRHEAYAHHSKLTHSELDAHFERFLKFPLLLDRDLDGDQFGLNSTQKQQLLHFYSDNNSCMRRSVWDEIPYPEVDYGEDQVWAHKIVNAGYKKIYAPTATVIHSHDYGPEETFKRCRTEAHFFYTHFGYKVVTESKPKLTASIQREQANKRKWFENNGYSQEKIAIEMANIEMKYKGLLAGLKKALEEKEAQKEGP